MPSPGFLLAHSWQAIGLLRTWTPSLKTFPMVNTTMIPFPSTSSVACPTALSSSRHRHIGGRRSHPHNPQPHPPEPLSLSEWGKRPFNGSRQRVSLRSIKVVRSDWRNCRPCRRRLPSPRRPAWPWASTTPTQSTPIQSEPANLRAVTAAARNSKKVRKMAVQNNLGCSYFNEQSFRVSLCGAEKYD